MAFLAIPAVGSFLSGGAAAGTLASTLGTAGAAGLSGAALGAAGSELTGGDWEDGALKGGLGAAGEAGAAADTAATAGDAMMNMDIAAAAAESGMGATEAASAASPWAEFGLEAARDGASNVVTTGAMQAATPEQTVRTPVAPPPELDVTDEQLMEFMRQQMQLDPARMQLQPLTLA
jgi:hypothetical protein